MAASEQTVANIQWQSQTSKIVIDPEFRDLIQPLTSEELDLLEKSLIEEGCRDSLKVCSDGRLLDGHHRLAFCEKHGIPYRIDIVDGIADRIDAKIWIITNQFARRNLSNFARSELALQLKPLIAEKAKERMLAGVKQDPTQNSSEGETREELAKIAIVSHDTISKTETILKKGSDLLKEAARAGTVSVNAAAEIVELPLATQDKIVKSDKQEITARAIKAYKKQEKRKQTKAAFESYKAPVEMDRVLKWAKLLEGESDIDRLEKLSDGNDDLNCNPRPYDVWFYNGSHPLFGREGYPGRIPGQIVLQLLYFFTQPGDLVVDPFAGGGTTIDACAVMGRRCLAYDSEPETCAARADIKLQDAIEAIKSLTTVGSSPRPDLIFLDTPYFSKKDKEYGNHSISRLNRTEYLKFFSDLAAAAHETLNKGGHVALLMSDYIDEDNPDEEIFIEDYIDIFKKAGFRRTRRIHCDLSTQQIHPDYINKFTDNKRLAILARDLVIFSLA